MPTGSAHKFKKVARRNGAHPSQSKSAGPLSVAKKNLLKRLKDFIQERISDPDQPLIFAAWSRVNEADIHLLEVAKNVPNPGDGSWMTFTFRPPPELDICDKSSRMKITYLSPQEFYKGVKYRKTKGNKKFKDIMRDGWVLLHSAENDPDADKIQGMLNHEGEIGN